MEVPKAFIVLKDGVKDSSKLKKELKALIFDSLFDSYRGVITSIRVVDGEVHKGDIIKMMETNAVYDVVGLSINNPKEKEVDVFSTGDNKFDEEGDYKEDNMRSTVVPFRNGIMLSIAAGVAENEKLPYIMLANHGGDHTIYPDCRADFVDAMNKAVHFGTWNGVQLLTPYTHLTKAEIAQHGKELGLDYSETWSCYKGAEHHCGVCGTCRERIEALAQAGIEDNTIYKQ